jgi:hypothetical protein
LAEHVVQGQAGLELRMPASERALWLDALWASPAPEEPAEPPLAPSMSAIARLGGGGSGPVVLLATPRARPGAAALVATAIPHIPVLSITELERSGLETPTAIRWLEPP